MTTHSTAPVDDASPHAPSSSEKPHVLIIGAGIAGLTLGGLLHKAGVPFDIFEKAPVPRTVGSALFLGPDLYGYMKQAGIYEEFVSRSIPCNSIEYFGEDRKVDFVVDFTPYSEMGGCEGRIIGRTQLYDILLNAIPTERCHMGMKMVSMTQHDPATGKASVKFADKSEFSGDIIVGADGAYSAVRQSLYDELKAEKTLPSSDAADLPFSVICVAGYTSPMDTAKFPGLKDERSQFWNVLSRDKPYSWMTITTPNSVMSWSAFKYLRKGTTSATDSNLRRLGWGEEAAEAMCNDIRDFPVPGGDGTLTLADLIDATPKNQMTKVMLEEKIFDTWFHGRSVLMGDACHKVHPAGGQGALLGFHDAIALANWINVLPASPTIQELDVVFTEYKAERHPYATAAFEHARNMSNLSDKDLKATISRFVIKHIPDWLWRLSLAKMSANRPQVSFLPLVEDIGTVKSAYQASLDNTQKILRAKEEAKTAKPTTALAPIAV
ncbi:MAG: hypothetical protein J3R72DRAFT_447905 [Linnemannia gamsii]|nr:MAG: hypothetical protein J3R72DRAFT_447905 [Linnemannia gamsii]